MYDLKNSALIICDLQNYTLKKEGSFDKIGIDIQRNGKVIVPINKMITAFRKKKRPIVFTMMTLRKDFTDAGIINTVFPLLKGMGCCTKGSWDWQIIGKIDNRENDYYIEKTRFSSFYNTNLENLLRCLKVNTLVICGLSTNINVESTVRDAFNRDFNVIVPKDAAETYSDEAQAASFANFEFGFAQVSSSIDIIKNL